MNKHRAFNHSYEEADSFVKISREDRLFDEISYYQTISSYPQAELFAKFNGNFSNGLVYCLKLQNYNNCLNLSEHFFNFLQNNQPDKLTELTLQVLESFGKLHQNPGILFPEEFCFNSTYLNTKMLIDKTFNEYLKLSENSVLSKICNYDTLVINNKEYSNFSLIWQQIAQEIDSKYLNFDLTFIHGDACLSNMLLGDEGSIIFIDPRGSYGIKGCYGDKAYDYAKLLHSVSGNYEQIIYDLFTLDHNDHLINYSFKYDMSRLQDVIKDKIDDELFIKSKLIEGLIFVGMCARHYDSLDRQIIMYSTGIKILNEWMDLYL